MVAILHMASALAFLTYVSANPIVQRDSQLQFGLPKNYAALGDSYASGLGSGFFLNSSRDGSDIECLRQDGGYPSQLLKIFPHFVQPGQLFDNVACSGDVLGDIDGQIAKLGNKKFDLITLTIGGNDFGFDDAALACIYAQTLLEVDAQALCDATLDASMAGANDPAFWTLLTEKISLIRKQALAPSGRLFVTGYGKFFDEPMNGDACDKISFFPIAQLAALNMTAGNRRRANELVDLVNKNIEQTVEEVNEKEKRSWWKDHHNDEEGISRKRQVQFINYDKFFEGKRFCEQANAADPVGSNNPQVFFNDLVTVLATPGIALRENQTPGLGGVDITDGLQALSVFHPKGASPYVALAAEIAFVVLFDAVESNDVVIGPAEYCTEKKNHQHWSRDGHEREGGKHHCYNVPPNCAIVKTGEKARRPKVVCKDDWKMYDAEEVPWKDEWDW